MNITGNAASFLSQQAAAASSEIEILFFGSGEAAPPFSCFTYSAETELFFHLRMAWVRFRQLYLLRIPVVGYWDSYKQGAPAADALMASLHSYVPASAHVLAVQHAKQFSIVAG